MELPRVGDRVSLNGKEFVITDLDEEAGTASLESGDDVVDDVPLESLTGGEELDE